MYYIGVHTSSAFSRLIAITEQGKPLAHHVGKSSYIDTEGAGAVRENLMKLISEFNVLTKTRIEDCGGFCLAYPSLAAVRHDQLNEITNVIAHVAKQLGMNCQPRVISDARAIIIAESGVHTDENSVDSETVTVTGKVEDPAVLVIASKSTEAYGLDASGKLYKTGGWGSLIDDVGSGFWIGMEAIRASVYAYDGRNVKTNLTNKIKENFKTDIPEIVAAINSGKYNATRIAELAVCVKQAASEGDEAAMDIEDRAQDALFKLAKPIILKLINPKLKIYMSGSVFSLNGRIRQMFGKSVSEVFPNTELILAREKPELGAAGFALFEA